MRSVRAAVWRGIALGSIAFLVILAILLIAGELSASKFLYVDF